MNFTFDALPYNGSVFTVGNSSSPGNLVNGSETYGGMPGFNRMGQIVLTLLLSSFAVVGGVGNLLVIWAFSRQARRAVVSSLLIILLGITDLVICLVDIPVTLYLKVWFREATVVLCRLHGGLKGFIIPFSSGLLVLIALERFLLICFMPGTPLRPRATGYLIVGLFVICVGLAMPVSLRSTLLERNSQGDLLLPTMRPAALGGAGNRTAITAGQQRKRSGGGAVRSCMRDVSYLSDQAYWHYTIAQSLIYLTMFLLLTVIYATIFLFVRRRQMLMNVKYTYPTGFATRVSERVGLLHSTAGDEEDEADELILPDMPVGKADNPLDDGVNGTTSEGVSESVKQVGEEATDTDWPGKRLTGLPVHKVTVDEPTADLGLGLRQMNELRANSQEASPEISTGSQTAIGAIRQPDNRRQSQTVRPAEGTSSIVTMVTITGPHESTGAKKLQTEETIRLKMFSSPARPVEPIAKSSTDQLAVQTTTSRPKRSLDRVNQQPISTSEASSPVYPAGYTGSVYPAFCYCYCDPRGCCPAEGHDTGGWQLRWRWRWFWIRSDPGDLASEAEAETESWSRQRIGLTATESAISSLQTSQAASANTCTTDGDRVAVSQADARAGLEAVTKAQMMGNAGTSDTLDQQDDEFLLRPDADGPLVWNALLQPGKPGDISTSGTGEEGICARGLIAAARLQERRRRPYIRTAQTLVAITICFILSYLPFLVQGLLRPHVRPPMPYGTSIYGESSHFSLYLYFLNSVVNPIIYSCMNQHFQARICGLGRSLAAALSPSRKRGRGNHANEHGGARKCRRHLRGRRKCPDRSIAATTCCMSTPAADETVGPTVSSQNWSYCSSKQLYNADKNEHIISSYLADQNQYQTLVSIATDRLTEDAKCGTTGESEPPEWPGLCNKNEEEASTLTFSEARIKVCVPERGRSVR